MTLAPDTLLFTEPVIGFRAWRLRVGKSTLTPHGLRFTAPPWEPGVNTARCYKSCHVEQRIPVFVKGGPVYPHDPDDAPHNYCQCGLYAFHQLEPRRHETDRRTTMEATFVAVGAIKAWGRIQVHQAGFRAQHAMILALEIPTNEQDRAIAKRAAEHYNVPLLPADLLQLEARQHGQSLPAEAMPVVLWREGVSHER